MQELKSTLTTVAEKRGQSSTNPVLVVYNNAETNYSPVRFSVSDTEPYDLPSPINLFWYVTDSSSTLYDAVLRRTARTASGGLQNTWELVRDSSTVFAEQVWDVAKPEHLAAIDHADTVGNAHLLTTEDINAVNKAGGKMEGLLEPRTLNQGEQFDSKEVVPRSWIEAALAPIRSVNSAIIQAFSNTNTQIRSIRNRVQVLEDDALNSSSEGFVYRMAEASTSWNILHNMNNSELLIQVYEGAEMIWPASIAIVDANNVLIEFAVPVAGRADLLPIVEQT